jgi:hypothetical protein
MRAGSDTNGASALRAHQDGNALIREVIVLAIKLGSLPAEEHYEH